MLKKIFPAGVGNAPYNSFKLILVAEGYLAAESAKFAGDCVDLIEALLDITPFNLTRAHPHWLSVYSSYTQSANAGPAINQAAQAGRTLFDSSLTTATGVLSVSQPKFNTYVAAETIAVEGSATPLAGMCVQGGRSYAKTGTLIVVLLPPVVGQPAGGEAESALGANDYHFVAVTKDGRYEQVVARSIGQCLGLGDEFELAGAANLAPSSPIAGDILKYNLQYFEAAPPNPISADLKWYRLFSATKRVGAPSIHANLDTATPGRALDPVPTTHAEVEFWEGAGGYRSKVWRAASDCLMRRRIGDGTLPVRAASVPFCRVCRHHIADVVR